MGTTETLLTTVEIGAWARIAPESVTRLVREKRLWGVKLGREYRFTIDAVRAWSGFEEVTVEDIRAAAAREGVA